MAARMRPVLTALPWWSRRRESGLGRGCVAPHLLRGGGLGARRGAAVTGRWNLFTASGELLGTYPGASPAEAIRAMYETHPGLDSMLNGELDTLVKLWGGRAVCTGSERAMPAVTMPEIVVPVLDALCFLLTGELDGIPDTERGS